MQHQKYMAVAITVSHAVAKLDAAIGCGSERAVMVVAFAVVGYNSSSIVGSSRNGGQCPAGAAGTAAAGMQGSVQQEERAGITS